MATCTWQGKAWGIRCQREWRFQLSAGHPSAFVLRHEANFGFGPARDWSSRAFLDATKNPIILLVLGVALWRVVIDVLDSCPKLFISRGPLRWMGATRSPALLLLLESKPGHMQARQPGNQCEDSLLEGPWSGTKDKGIRGSSAESKSLILGDARLEVQNFEQVDRSISFVLGDKSEPASRRHWAGRLDVAGQLLQGLLLHGINKLTERELRQGQMDIEKHVDRLGESFAAPTNSSHECLEGDRVLYVIFTFGVADRRVQSKERPSKTCPRTWP